MTTRLPIAAVALRFTLGPQHLFVWLTPDADSRERALSHGLGHALAYDGRLRAPIRTAMLRLGRAFGELSGTPAPSELTAERLVALASRIAPDARLELVRVLPVGQRVPRPSAVLRQGEPPAEGSAIWPFDAELASLRAGRRRLIKRELHAEDLPAERHWLEKHDLHLRELHLDPEGMILFAAERAGVLDEAEEAELALRQGEGAEEATRWMGEALGYPACCIEAFTGCGSRTDDALDASRVAPALADPIAPETGWLLPPLAFVSHLPCEPDCPATRALASSILQRLDASCAGFEARWRALAQRVQVIDPSGRWLALAVDGALSEGAVVRDAVELDRGAAPDDVLRPVPALHGAPVRLERAVLIAGEGANRLEAGLWADHRA